MLDFGLSYPNVIGTLPCRHLQKRATETSEQGHHLW